MLSTNIVYPFLVHPLVYALFFISVIWRVNWQRQRGRPPAEKTSYGFRTGAGRSICTSTGPLKRYLLKEKCRPFQPTPALALNREH